MEVDLDLCGMRKVESVALHRLPEIDRLRLRCRRESVEITRLQTGNRSWYDYESGDSHLMKSVISTAGEPDRAILYGDASVVVTSIDSVLETPRQFAGQLNSGAIAAGQTSRHAFVMDAKEFATSSTGRVTIGVEVLGQGGFSPGTPRITGLTAVSSLVETGRSIALFQFDRADSYVLELAGADATTSGAFTAELYIVGDVNDDAAVNGADELLFAAAFGSSRGQAAYNAAADANRDGQVNLADRQLFDSTFGFSANQHPVVTSAAARTSRGLPVVIDLAPRTTDPDADPLSFALLNSVNGTVTLTGDGRHALFVPAAGFSGNASFELVADDERASLG